MAEAAALATAHLSRYDALLRVSKTLAGHKTMAELFQVLADNLHPVVPFDYLALILHDAPSDHLHLVVLEPGDIVVPAEIRVTARCRTWAGGDRLGNTKGNRHPDPRDRATTSGGA